MGVLVQMPVSSSRDQITQEQLLLLMRLRAKRLLLWGLEQATQAQIEESLRNGARIEPGPLSYEPKKRWK